MEKEIQKVLLSVLVWALQPELAKATQTATQKALKSLPCKCDQRIGCCSQRCTSSRSRSRT